MPTDNDDIEDEIMDEDDIKDLREAANRSKANKAEAEAARRELAFVKAGVDTDSKLGKMILASYDGDLDKDAIKEYLADVPGFAPTEEEKPEETIDESEQRSTSERNGLANDSKGDEGGKPDPRKAGREAAKQVLDDGGSMDDSLAAHFQTIVAAAKEGDERVRIA